MLRKKQARDQLHRRRLKSADLTAARTNFPGSNDHNFDNSGSNLKPGGKLFAPELKLSKPHAAKLRNLDAVFDQTS